jgi:ribosomal protein S18 acetylase RimI-like enzyme
MNPALRLRTLTRADLPFADSVRAGAGWNQTFADWDRFISLAPDGCFLAEWNGAPAGTATTIAYGADLAWIGMVLVHPEFRRRGIGRALMALCIAHLQGRGVRGIKLDATPEGRTVYESLGFKDEWTLTRWQREPRANESIEVDRRLRRWNEADTRAIDTIDTAAFGVSRRKLVQALAEESRCALVLESEPGRIAGYGLLRDGSQSPYLGPVVATSTDIGRRLVDTLLARGSGKSIVWDIPDQNVAAVAWARQRGFTVQRPLTRMVLGENTAHGDPQMQFAIAGPEVG